MIRFRIARIELNRLIYPVRESALQTRRSPLELLGSGGLFGSWVRGQDLNL